MQIQSEVCRLPKSVHIHTYLHSFHAKSHKYMNMYTLCTSLPISVLLVMHGRQATNSTFECDLIKKSSKERCDHPPAAAWFPGRAVPAGHLLPAAACPSSAKCIQPAEIVHVKATHMQNDCLC